jgi:hypothetical protein
MRVPGRGCVRRPIGQLRSSGEPSENVMPHQRRTVRGPSTPFWAWAGCSSSAKSLPSALI